jgi:hypothetical protein
VAKAKSENKSAKKSRRDEARDRASILEYFLANPDRIISNAELGAMLGAERQDSWTRRLRELRKPEHGGYTIYSVYDKKGLKRDEYVFPKQDRKERKNTIRISNRLRGEVFHRDAYTCQACGISLGERYEDGRGVKLHVGHNVAESLGGKTTLDNCFTVCSRCNEAESNVGSERPTVLKTMAQVKRLPQHEKREVYDYLKRVFEE